MAYSDWFRKIIYVLIELFYLFSIVVTLYVFTSVFSGTTKIIIFIVLLMVYALIVYSLKDKIKSLLQSIIKRLKKVDTKTMILILSLIMILLKVICCLFFNFDATVDGDTQIYIDIANQIIETGNLHTNAISHLFGVALHFTLFKLLNIPISTGLFIVVYIGTIFNFLSFKQIIGKEKSFIGTFLYIVMPSSALLTFCPTHELFLYMYLSLFLFAFCKLINEKKNARIALFAIACVISSILACFVNPSGYIIWIIMSLTILFARILNNKKIVIIFTLVLSIIGSNALTKVLDVNEHVTTMNTYTILIHGSNPESLGEQVDGYPLHKMREYIYDHTLDFSHKGFEDAGRQVLLNQYKYLLAHPVNLIKLVVHKFYILWSGNHYSIEIAHTFGGVNDITFYILLIISTLIYLFVLSVGLFLSKKTKDSVLITNYKLAILGCFGVTMLSIVTNKYSLYVTLFIYLISFYKIDIDENK